MMVRPSPARRSSVLADHVLPAPTPVRQSSVLASRALSATNPEALTEAIADTACGPIKGVGCTDGSAVFKGIPFAAPPVGHLRWRKPQPHASWGPGPRDCTEFGHCALQAGAGLPGGFPGGYDESCLYLNIWTPPKWDKSARLPVFMWIHGGGFSVGSGSQPDFDGARLAGEGVVVVTINYRLGVLGFHRPRGDADSNCGLWDQVEALRWIQQNIANFGGDPANVTISGESAGGACVVYLAASPVANKLFRRGISMSGIAWYCVDGPTMDLIAEQFARAATGAPATADDLRALGGSELVACQGGSTSLAPDQGIMWLNLCPGSYQTGRDLDNLGELYEAAGPFHCMFPPADLKGYGLTYPNACPVLVVGDELLPQMPLDLLAAGGAAHIDLMVGANREEFAFSTVPSTGHPGLQSWGSEVRTLEDAAARCAREFMGLGRIRQPAAAARALVREYASSELEGGVAQAGTIQHAWDRLVADMAFNASAVMVAARQHWHNPGRTFVYRYDGNNKSNAFHGWEVKFVLGNFQVPPTPRQERLRAAMLGSFARFARTGDPNGAPGVPPWPSWGTAGTSGQVLQFDLGGCSTGVYGQAAPAMGKVVDLLDGALTHAQKTSQLSRL